MTSTAKYGESRIGNNISTTYDAANKLFVYMVLGYK